MRRFFLLWLTAMGLATATAHAADAASDAVDPALVDAIVRKLESDGTLDRAAERALTRVIERRQTVQREAQARDGAALVRFLRPDPPGQTRLCRPAPVLHPRL